MATSLFSGKKQSGAPEKSASSSTGMAASSGAVTGSAALTELKKDLTQLSATLHEIFELMNMDMRNIGTDWQDGKYQEFVEGYRPQINKCEEISERYKEWCMRVLDPTIENVISVEKTDVGGGSSGSVGGTFGGGSAGDIGESGATVAPATSRIGSIGRLGRVSNLGNGTPTASNNQTRSVRSASQSTRSTNGRLSTSIDNSATRTTFARSAAKPTTSPSSNAARSATKSATNNSQTSAKIGDDKGKFTHLPIDKKKNPTQTAQEKNTTQVKKTTNKDNPSTKLTPAQRAEQRCQESGMHQKPGTNSDHTGYMDEDVIKSSDKFDANLNAEGKLKVDIKEDSLAGKFLDGVGVKGGGEVGLGGNVGYDNAKETTTGGGRYYYKCVDDNKANQ